MYKRQPFADAIEEAVDFVRPTAGRRYLIVKAEDRRALLDELRQATANANVCLLYTSPGRAPPRAAKRHFLPQNRAKSRQISQNRARSR